MTHQEYTSIINELVLSGKGYSAIRDITVLLEMKDSNIESAIKEYRAERKVLRKLCTESKTKKELLKVIFDMIGD